MTIKVVDLRDQVPNENCGRAGSFHQLDRSAGKAGDSGLPPALRLIIA